MVRKTIQLPDHIAEWIVNRSKKDGIPQAYVIINAINTYIDQQKTIDNMVQLPDFLQQLNEMQEKQKSLKS